MEIIHLLSAVRAFGAAILLAAEVLARGRSFLGQRLPVRRSPERAGGAADRVRLPGLRSLRHRLLPRETRRTRRSEPTRPDAQPLQKLRKYYALTPLFAFSMFLVAVANNLGVMWVALEGTTLASIFLVTFYGRPTSLEAAWKYAMIGGVGLSMALFGTILTYYAAHQVLGTESLSALNWSVLAASAAQFDHTVMRLAFILVLLGYGTKAGLAPMHTWKPDAYSEAPVPVAALMAAAVLNCAVYGLARFYVLTVRCLGPDFPSQLLILFGFLSIGIAVPFILVQRSYRRLLAYSSIDHGGIMVLGLGFGGALGALGHAAPHDASTPSPSRCCSSAPATRSSRPATIRCRKAPGGLLHVSARQRPDVPAGHPCRHGHATLQPVSERVHHPARRIRRAARRVVDPVRGAAGRHLLRASSTTSRNSCWVRPALRRAESRAAGRHIRSSASPRSWSVLGFWLPRAVYRAGRGRGAHSGGASMTDHPAPAVRRNPRRGRRPLRQADGRTGGRDLCRPARCRCRDAAAGILRSGGLPACRRLRRRPRSPKKALLSLLRLRAPGGQPLPARCGLLSQRRARRFHPWRPKSPP